MLLHGITPGLFLLRDRPDVFWGVIGSFYLGNIMLLILNLPLVGLFAKIVRVKNQYLLPIILVLCAIGSFGDNGALFDLWVMLAAGVLGYIMRKFDYEPAPLVVGLVLGPVMERSFRQALIISQGDPGGLWASSLSIALWGITLFALVLPMVLPPMKQKVKSLRKASKKLDHHRGDLE